jgi:hypothetical protein
MGSVMLRYNDWEPRLSEYLKSVMKTPFEYGTHDCALFVCGAIESMTGTDFSEGFRGNYSTPEEGKALLKKSGFDTPLGFLNRKFKKIHPSKALSGDICVIGGRKFAGMGVVSGANAYVMGESFLRIVLVTNCSHIYRV